jgi:phosphatidyl-myo-inositol alpha-mannosyltransferase
MKIGIVGDDTLDKTDGVEQYILTVGRWLAEEGHEVHYLVGETHRTDLSHLHSLSKNVKVRFNGNRLSIPLPASKTRIRQLLGKENFDVLYVQMPYSPALAARIVTAAGPRTAVVGAFHILPNNLLADWATRALRVVLSRNLRRFDKLLSVSTAAQKFAKDAFRIDTVFIPNASPLKPFFEGQPFPLYKNTLTVLCHGRLVERKGCGLFLAVVARLHTEGRWPVGAQVLISGAGPLETKLKQFVRTQALDDVVTFLGFIAEEDKPRFMASADIVVYPSTGGESFGIVLLEAMAASRGAVLAGDNPGYASVMSPRPDSLFNPLDLDAFTEKLLKYLTDEKLRKRARDWQQKYVKQYDVPVVGKKLVALFEEALHKRRS